MTKNTILIVDDEPSVLSSLHRALRSEHWDIISELSAEQALARMRERTIKVVITDERMAKMQGAEFLSLIRALYPQTVRILLTGHASLESAIKVINDAEVFRFLTKPWNNENLIQVVRDALHKYDREQQIMKVFKRYGDQPHMFTDIEKKFPGISRFIRDKQGVMSLPALSDDELEEVLKLLSPIKI